VEAARWLSDLWSTLGSELHLLVVGSVGEHLSRTSDNVHVVGYVDDLQSVLGMADIALNPATSGGGSNVKLLDYFAAGLAVVSTPFGAEGFDVADGDQLLIRERDSFVEGIELLSGDETYRDELANSALQTVTENYTWENLSERLRTILKRELVY